MLSLPGEGEGVGSLADFFDFDFEEAEYLSFYLSFFRLLRKLGMRGYLQHGIIGGSAYFICARRGDGACGSLGGVTVILGCGRRGLFIFCEYFKLWRKRGDRLLPPLLAIFGLNMN